MKKTMLLNVAIVSIITALHAAPIASIYYANTQDTLAPETGIVSMNILDLNMVGEDKIDTPEAIEVSEPEAEEISKNIDEKVVEEKTAEEKVAPVKPVKEAPVVAVEDKTAEKTIAKVKEEIKKPVKQEVPKKVVKKTEPPKKKVVKKQPVPKKTATKTKRSSNAVADYTSRQARKGGAPLISHSRIAFINEPRPTYPRKDKRQGNTGVTTVLLEINKNGRVTNVKIKKSSGHSGLDKAALNAAKKMVIRPFMENGVPINIKYEKEYAFQLL